MGQLVFKTNAEKCSTLATVLCLLRSPPPSLPCNVCRYTALSSLLVLRTCTLLQFGHAVVFEREEREAREHAAAHGHADHGDGGYAEHSTSGHAEEPAAVVPPSNTEDVLAEKDAVAPA